MNFLEDCPLDQFVVPAEWHGLRLDKLLALKYSDIQSRTYFQKLIEKGLVSLNGSPALKKRDLIAEGTEIEVQFENAAPPEATPENIPLEILYEDESLLVVNKPPGMVVHPAPGNWTGTFANALLFHCGSGLEGNSLRPGIIHRLDKDTSGLLVAAKNATSLRKMTELFASRSVYKEYLAICVGNPGNQTIDSPIGRHVRERQKMSVRADGKPARTDVHTFYTHKGLSVVSAILHTGRTHQIRVHLQNIGCPILGDSTYGSTSWNQRSGVKRQMLHAWKLRFMHPLSGKKMEFCVSPPEDMLNFLDRQLGGYSLCG